MDKLSKNWVSIAYYLDNTKWVLSKEAGKYKQKLRGRVMENGMAISILAEEIAVMYKKMSEKQENPRRAGLLKLASEILEDFALEVIRSGISQPTLERLTVIEKMLKLNGLPSGRLGRLVRAARKYVVAPLPSYLPPQVEISNSILS